MGIVGGDHAGLPDPTHYPVEDDLGEGLLQKLIVTLHLPLARRFFAERDVSAATSSSTGSSTSPPAPSLPTFT